MKKVARTEFKQTEMGAIPVDWMTIRLGEACSKIGSGFTPRGGKEVYKESGIALVRSQNVYNNSFSKDGLAYLDDSTAREMENVALEKDDVLLNITGDSVARCCTVPEDILPARVNQHVSIIRTDREQVNPTFLRYYLTSPRMQSFMLGLAQSGGTRNALTKGIIENFLVPRPPLGEQAMIGQTLSRMDTMIAINQQMNESLEAMTKVIFKHWFVDFELPNEEGKPYKSSGGEMVDSELGEIPKGWRARVIPEIADVVYGYPFNSRLFNDETGFPLVRIRDLPTNKPGTLTTEESDVRYVIRKGDIISGMDGEFGTYLWKGRDMLQNQRICRFIGKAKHYSNAFLFFVVSKPLRTIENAKVGTTVIHLSKTDIDSTKIIVPPQDVLEKYNGLLVPLFERMVSNGQLSLVLEQLRDSFLPKLMSGKIRVPIEAR